MWTTLITVSVFIITAGITEAATPRHLPSYLTPCKKDAPDFDDCCLAEARKSIPHLKAGEKKYGIPSFSPLKLEKVEVNSGNFKITLKNLDIWGVTEVEIDKMKFDLEKKQVSVQFHSPHIELISKYEMDGKLLVLPIQGNGDANITLDEPKFSYIVNYKLVKKENFDYIQINDDSNIEFTIKKVHLKFTNLFNGNEQLSKTTQQVINDEWESVLDELSPAIKGAIQSIAGLIINGVASRVPYQYLFT